MKANKVSIVYNKMQSINKYAEIVVNHFLQEYT